MDFQQFIFNQEQSQNWNKPSPGYESTNLSSNQFNEDSCSDSSREKGSQITKLIRKKYDPIVDGDKVYRYEDNPVEYKKARKKIQNRQSATRVRGKKKNYVETLQCEVAELKQKNSSLLLINAKIQSENLMLRERVTFFQKFVLKQKYDQVDSYITTDKPHSIVSQSPQHQSPFESITEEDSWQRVSPSKKIGKDWFVFTVFTIIIGIMMLPGDKSSQKIGMIAAKINENHSQQIKQMCAKLLLQSQRIQIRDYNFKLCILAIYLIVLGILIYKKRHILKKIKIKSF